MSPDNPDRDNHLEARARWLAVQRVLFAAHLIAFAAALLFSRGLLPARMPLVLAVWILALLMHTTYLALYEHREFALRDDEQYSEAAGGEKVKRSGAPDAAFTVGDDGELIPTSDDGSRRARPAGGTFNGNVPDDRTT